MFRKKMPIFVLIAILLASLAILFSGDGVDQDLVQRLAHRQQLDENSFLDHESNTGRAHQSRKLTAETFVTQGRLKHSWTVESPKAAVNTTVELPFDPTLAAERPSPDRLESRPATVANPGFLGANACAECHQEKYRGFVDTGHHQTSALVTRDSRLGSFAAPGNVLKTPDPSLYFTMSRGENVVQRVTLADWSHKIPMDVVVGSAKVGQSFLYWHGDALYQMHVSYLTQTNGWIASPGYIDTKAHYARPVRDGCLECHITYVQRVKSPDHFARDTAIWGISCERCHGPGRDHVEFHHEHPDVKQSKYITHPGHLTRQRQLDICGQCHSGRFVLRQGAFTFRPGDELDAFHGALQPASDDAGGIHTSNQLTRLQKSRCFQHSEMTCTTCHNPHKNQRGDTAVFTQSCLGCHQSNHCGMATELGQRVSENCIACHMPISQNEDLADIAHGDLQTLTVDHYIRVDAAATRRYLGK